MDRGDGRPEITNTSDSKWVGPASRVKRPARVEVMNMDELIKRI
jgi:hypothetical protein